MHEFLGRGQVSPSAQRAQEAASTLGNDYVSSSLDQSGISEAEQADLLAGEAAAYRQHVSYGPDAPKFRTVEWLPPKTVRYLNSLSDVDRHEAIFKMWLGDLVVPDMPKPEESTTRPRKVVTLTEEQLRRQKESDATWDSWIDKK